MAHVIYFLSLIERSTVLIARVMRTCGMRHGLEAPCYVELIHKFTKK